jgi:large repetitive protein
MEATMHRLLLGTILLAACEEPAKIDTDPITDEGELLSDNDADGYLSDEDCDDEDPSVNPGASEVCDGFDNDCDNQADEDVTETFYADSDNDGFGSQGITVDACSAPSGFVSNGSDCDDTDASAYPSAEEICDGADNDCNGEVDDGLDGIFYIDADGDGIGDENNAVEGCGIDQGLSTVSGDCNDEDPDISPLVEEVCDGIDNNCDGSIDEDTLGTYYLDSDDDGYGDDDQSTEACDAPEGYVGQGGDCDDIESYAHPGLTEICDGIDNDCNEEVDEGVSTLLYLDADLDGHGDDTQPLESCGLMDGYESTGGDCDDSDASVHPDAGEYCDGKDNDCDGVSDEEDALDALLWYGDTDGDGFGDETLPANACTQPFAHVENALDCDDSDDDINPDAGEICNGADDDCNGETDEADTTETSLWYQDSDGDGYGDADSAVASCDQPVGHLADATDCDDQDNDIFPGADESCNGEDDDCDGDTDEEPAQGISYFADSDGDGYGDPETVLSACEEQVGHVADDTDCNDGNGDVNPAAPEICNGEDDDCNGFTDDDDPGLSDASTWYLDHDSDGYGDEDHPQDSCSQPAGYVADNTDCQDLWYMMSPAVQEICDGFDNDCDGLVDDADTDTDAASLLVFYADTDEDGYGDPASPAEACEQPAGYVESAEDCDDQVQAVSPEGVESCNGTDDDCDGLVDDDDPDAIGETEWFLDHDYDGYGDASHATTACDQPDGYVANSSDCYDLWNMMSPDMTEVCDGYDNDCNGLTDEEDGDLDASSLLEFYEDVDQDSFGTPESTAQGCTAPDGFVADSADCNDGSSDIKPGVPEVCDGIDNDCNGLVDDGDPDADTSTGTVYYADGDGDGYGDADASESFCAVPEGFVNNSEDCDDDNDSLDIATDEICDGIDNNCDSSIDEGFDSDGDGTADCFDTEECDGVDNDGDGDIDEGFDSDDDGITDCEDTEECDGVDNDGDGDIDEGFDSDDDGISDCNDTEECDGVDNDGDGDIDEGFDSDGDGTADCFDTEECDGVDNDGDGDIDEGLTGQECPAADCLGILEADASSPTGSYWIDPDGSGAVEVTCDMDTDGGGWTPVLHLYDIGALAKADFDALFGHLRFTDEDWSYSAADGMNAGNSSLVTLTGQGALDISRFDDMWEDVRMGCSSSSNDSAVQHHAQIDGYTITNGNNLLLGAADNGNSYSVPSDSNSFGNTTIWHDNEIDSENSGHYICDVTSNNTSSGTTQFSFCYTDFLNNNNSVEMGDSIVGIAFGYNYTETDWSSGFSAECGDMDSGYLSDSGTFWIWIR